MTEMVERVARALAEVDANHEIYHQRPYVEWARAAITAMREPTKEMVRAGFRDWGGTSGTWQAMIDAALEEPEE